MWRAAAVAVDAAGEGQGGRTRSGCHLERRDSRVAAEGEASPKLHKRRQADVKRPWRAMCRKARAEAVVKVPGVEGGGAGGSAAGVGMADS